MSNKPNSHARVVDVGFHRGAGEYHAMHARITNQRRELAALNLATSGLYEALRGACTDRDRYRRALESIRDYTDGRREAGQDIDQHEVAIYNTARQALAGGISHGE